MSYTVPSRFFLSHGAHRSGSILFDFRSMFAVLCFVTATRAPLKTTVFVRFLALCVLRAVCGREHRDLGGIDSQGVSIPLFVGLSGP